MKPGQESVDAKLHGGAEHKAIRTREKTRVEKPLQPRPEKADHLLYPVEDRGFFGRLKNAMFCDPG